MNVSQLKTLQRMHYWRWTAEFPFGIHSLPHASAHLLVASDKQIEYAVVLQGRSAGLIGFGLD
jgi:hypothetical protein